MRSRGQKEGSLDKRVMILGALGFMALAAIFFFVGLICLGPMIRSRLETPKPVQTQTPRPYTQSRERANGSSDEQVPSINLEITERTAKDESQDEGVRMEEDGITVTLEPERPEKPAKAKPETEEEPTDARIPEQEVSIDPPRVATTGTRIYRVQAGTFANKANADRLMADLKARGYKPEIRSSESGDRTLYRIQLGGYKTQEDAQELAKDLKAEGFEPAVVAEDKD